MWAGIVGLIGAILTGVGEFMIHFNPDPSVTNQDYGFFIDIPQHRISIGHFIAVLSAPLYIAGYYHVYNMLKPAGGLMPRALFNMAIYTFMIGIIWLGSRAMLGEVSRDVFAHTAPADLLSYYTLYSESLIQVVRVGILLISGVYAVRILKGGTLYPKWMVAFSPIILLVLIFLSYFYLPAIGDYLLPPALNVAHTIFFAASLYVLFKLKNTVREEASNA